MLPSLPANDMSNSSACSWSILAFKKWDQEIRNNTGSAW